MSSRHTDPNHSLAPNRLGLKLKRSSLALSLLLLSAFCTPTRAQWQDQTFVLKPGWNAVYLHVDASHVALDTLVGANPSLPIDEIWLWKPVLAADRFIDDPQSPSDPNIDWAHWTRASGPGDELVRLTGNAAYLVRNTNSTDYIWTVRGQPTIPRYSWTSKGVNLIGFSTPETTPSVFASFLSPVPALRSQGEFYSYDDGNTDLTPTKINAFLNTLPVTRGRAYWISWKDNFNHYFGAFDASLQNPSGVHFNDSLSQYKLRLKNNTSVDLKVTMSLLPSASPPAGQTAIAGVPPLLLRGELVVTNLTYTHTNFATAQSITLRPAGETGSEAEIVLGLDRAGMTGDPDDLYAGILRLTDSLGYSQFDLPVTATVASKAGLWVGSALVTHVRHYLNNYLRDSNGVPVLSVLTTNGARYVVTNVNTSLGATARPFPLRLILHHDLTGSNNYLLQRVYTGIGHATKSFIVATTENLLHKDFLTDARRISAPHLPWSRSNTGWKFQPGQFGSGGKLTNVVTLLHDEQASNPFLHTYHPDHDNLTAQFNTPLDPGEESYEIERLIVLEFLPVPSDFGSVTAAGGQLIGNYNEDITFKGRGGEQRTIQTAGTFAINRISDLGVLSR